MAKTKTKTKSVDEDLELDELDDDEVEEAPAKKKTAAQQDVTFGVADLSKLLSKKVGKTIQPKDLRTLIRKMARDGSGRVDREIVAGNKARYDWPKGTKEPEVQAIIKAVLAGELEEGKREALAKLKADKAKRDAAAGGKKKGKVAKKGKKAPVEDEDEIEEIEDFDEDE